MKVVALPKRGSGAMTTWAEGAFDDRTLVAAGGIVLFDAGAHAVERVASPGAAPETLYRAPAGFQLAGLVASGGRLYVGQRHVDR